MVIPVTVEPGLAAVNGIVSVGIAVAILAGRSYFLASTTVAP
jgi:hypothetical protein